MFCELSDCPILVRRSLSSTRRVLTQLTRSRIPVETLIYNIPLSYDLDNAHRCLERTAAINPHVKYPVLHFTLTLPSPPPSPDTYKKTAKAMIDRLCQTRSRHGASLSIIDNQHIALLKRSAGKVATIEIHLFVNSINRYGQICFLVQEDSQAYFAIWGISETVISRNFTSLQKAP